MSIEKVKAYFKQYGREKDILEFDISSATVELAAVAVGVIPARIAKTLSFKTENGCMLIVAAGDARIDNQKFKARFGFKARMLTPEEAVDLTGHAVGGVCPFGIENPNVNVYLDVSMKRFETVFPAAGSGNSAIELTPDELEKYSNAKAWIDVCKSWQDEEQQAI
jgi:prolyl-tRNA editing enzyme YbaK/EbsC (Cys-tRNA(Pro) deacylase)